MTTRNNAAAKGAAKKEKGQGVYLALAHPHGEFTDEESGFEVFRDEVKLLEGTPPRGVARALAVGRLIAVDGPEAEATAEGQDGAGNA